MSDVDDGYRSLNAFVRGTWLLLGLQLFVAVVVFGALVFAGYRLNATMKATADVQTNLTRVKADLKKLEEKRDSLAEAYPRLRDGLSAIGADNLTLAREQLERADEVSKDEPFILRPLSDVQARLSDYTAAANTRQRVLDLDVGGDAGAKAADILYLAEYKCRAGDTAGADALLTDQFIAANKDAAAKFAASVQTPCSSRVVAAAPPPAVDVSKNAAASATIDPAFKIQLVFLHINAEADRPRAIEVAKAICAAGYHMRGIELVPQSYPAGGDVRFYYEQQAGQTAEIVELVRAVAKEWTPQRAPHQLRGYQDLPQDRIEVWFPPPAGEAVAPAQQADKRFRC